MIINSLKKQAIGFSKLDIRMKSLAVLIFFYFLFMLSVVIFLSVSFVLYNPVLAILSIASLLLLFFLIYIFNQWGHKLSSDS